ncbi:MAG: ubiquinone/menaquinone biosynthesis methyltransferase [Verrucomicrobiota bacterium]
MKHPRTAKQVETLFSRVARRYDFLNHLLSGGVDYYWRGFLAQRVREQYPTDLLDLATGSGDVLISLTQGRAYQGIGVGADFCVPMLQVAHKKGLKNLSAGDAMALPFQNDSFDAVTISFGYRNVVDREEALAEIYRVLRPGGFLYLLEFSHPILWWKDFYWKYLVEILPVMAHVWGAEVADYDYLAETIRRFPTQESLVSELKRGGFNAACYWNLTGGIAALHMAHKPVE